MIAEEEFNGPLVGRGDILVAYLTAVFTRLRVTNEWLRTAHEQLDALPDRVLHAKLKSQALWF